MIKNNDNDKNYTFDDNESLQDLFKTISRIERDEVNYIDNDGNDQDDLEMMVEKEYQTLKRVQVPYTFHKNRFIDQPKTNNTIVASSLQYNTVYASRLEKLRPILLQQVEQKYSEITIQKILHLKPNDECVMIGTLYKEMDLKQNILKQYAQDRAILPPPAQRDSFIGEGDKLFFEDETGRVKLIADKQVVDSLLTGMNVAIKGKGLLGAEFEIEEVFYPGLPPQPHSKDLENLEDDVYVCLVSGLSIGDPNNTLQLNMLVDYISGNLGTSKDQKFISRISRLIIAGNSIFKEEQSHQSFMKYLSKQEINSKKQKMAIPIKEFDSILSELAKSIPIDIIPGPNDPTNSSLPQLPLNYCLFPFSVQNTNTNPTSNPYESQIGGRLFLGTAGQNIDNASRYMIIDSKMDLTEKTLNWRHLAPTAPDTLSCSAVDHDPFVIEQCPHVYFIGNQEKYQTKMIRGPNDQIIRIVLLPKFSESNTIVLVNLKTLDTFPIEFNCTTFFPQSPCSSS
ncbi:hypothetical protein CYY_002331 [Polysphondylium violaceum]|uniref:DNA polymerase delta small subunit n=1 Tax=Polysphondylium violaceum TaxID=133409 RepID=A0A8J4Q1T4_9MYCE|nr:hypothetical protein CYY_002331 [Polysphondylium violaceum]